MAETKQKPTPWPLDVRAHSHGVEVRGPLGIGVGWFGCSTTAGIDGSYNITAEEAAANARMFASAGDLLEALRGLLEAVEDIMPAGSSFATTADAIAAQNAWGERRQKALEAARAAISSAEGEQ